MNVRLLLPALCLVLLAACIGPRPRILVDDPPKAEPDPTPKPLRQTPPQSTPPPGPSSDEVWLTEMLIQRLELTAALAWTRFSLASDQDSLAVQAQKSALREQIARTGLPPDLVGPLMDAQLDAAASYTDFLHKQWATPRKRPRNQPPAESSIQIQIDAVDLQILATLARLRGIPTGRHMVSFTREKLRARGIPRRTADLASAPFQP